MTCREEFPHIQKLADELEGRDDVAIYSLNSGVDKLKTVQAFWRDMGHTWPAVVDAPDARPGDLAEALGAKRFPVNVLIDADGIVRHAKYGWDEAVEARLRGLLGLE